MYIFFLSDGNTVSADGQKRYVDVVDADTADPSAADPSAAAAVCPFFGCPQELERALTVLSSCTWDACDDSSRTKLFEARIELTELAGFADIAAAVRSTADQAARAPAAAKVGPDELDSYEALVRDAGKFYIVLTPVTLKIN